MRDAKSEVVLAIACGLVLAVLPQIPERRRALPALGAAHAQKEPDTYRWTDKNGRVHYGTNPPAGVKAAKVDKRVSTATAVNAGNKSSAAPKAIKFESVATENKRKAKEDSDKASR